MGVYIFNKRAGYNTFIIETNKDAACDTAPFCFKNLPAASKPQRSRRWGDKPGREKERRIPAPPGKAGPTGRNPQKSLTGASAAGEEKPEKLLHRLRMRHHAKPYWPREKDTVKREMKRLRAVERETLNRRKQPRRRGLKTAALPSCFKGAKPPLHAFFETPVSR